MDARVKCINRDYGDKVLKQKRDLIPKQDADCVLE